jgi:hypothetical protein
MRILCPKCCGTFEVLDSSVMVTCFLMDAGGRICGRQIVLDRGGHVSDGLVIESHTEMLKIPSGEGNAARFSTA